MTARLGLRLERVILITLSIMLALPVLTVFAAWLTPDAALWQHIRDTLLEEMLLNSLLLTAGVAIGVTLLGTGLAALVSHFDFPGKSILQWALLLPFAVPAYVLAFVWLGQVNYDGPLQQWLQHAAGLTPFDLREHRLGIILLFTLVFYPYVYLPALQAFRSQSQSLHEVAALAGYGRLQRFWRVSLAAARPAIAAGTLLAVMETLSDFGVVAMFNYTTFTTAIYSAWEDYRSVSMAAQIASLLVVAGLALILLEQHTRRKKVTIQTHSTPFVSIRLHGLKAWLAAAVPTALLLISFVWPIGTLTVWAFDTFREEWSAEYLQRVGDSVSLALIAALLTAAIAALQTTLKHQTGSRFSERSLLAISTLGYALPGSVMAVGLMYGITTLLPWATLGSLWILLFAYTSRFFAVAVAPIDSAAGRIHPQYNEAAQLLGASRWRRFWHIRFPLLLPGLGIAVILVTLDVLKELPATYLLRPYGWQTLSMRIYNLTSEGLYQRAAIPALLLVAITLALLYIYYLAQSRSDRAAGRAAKNTGATT